MVFSMKECIGLRICILIICSLSTWPAVGAGLVINRDFPQWIVLWLWTTVCASACVGGWFLGEAHGRFAGDEAAMGEGSAVHALGAEAFGWLGVKEILHLL